MNTANDILQYAESHDIHLRVKGEKLAIDAPKEVLTDEFLSAAKLHKAELLTLIHPQLMALIRQIVKGYQITPNQFLALTTAEDRESILSGQDSIEDLRGYAKSMAEGIRDRRIVFHADGRLLRHN